MNNPEIYVIGILLIFSIISISKKLLDRDGLIIANIFGLTVFLFGGLSSFLVLVFFFSVAEIATKIGCKRIGKGHGRRTTSNIAGNGFPALIFLVAGSTIGFYGGLSAALADTLSSEIGMLSKKKPRLITNLEKQVKPGTDGGITLLGVIAAFFGAMCISITYFWLYGNSIALAIIILCGILGCFIDSLLGAEFELKGRLNNMQVNFLGSAAGALTAHILGMFLI